MTETLIIQQKDKWISYVQRAAEYDSFHTWNYHSLDKSGTPLLFVYKEDDEFIAIPFIKKNIEGTSYSDFSSAYGYVGPMASKHFEKLSNSLKENFRLALAQFLKAENCISVFCRLHPFYQQALLLEKFGGHHDNGYTWVIDLTEPIEIQRKAYRNTTYDSIKKSWKKGYQIRDEKSEEAINTFLSIYIETMNRVDADEFYRFDYDYIYKLLHTDEYDARLLTAYDGEIPMASTVVLISNNIIQAYLMATKQAYLKYSPARFIVDAVTELGRSLGAKYYNLGGGVGFKEDGLYEWKNSFTKLRFKYNSWRYIANPSVYQELLDDKGIDANIDVDFFPLYRLSNDHLLLKC